MSIYLIRHAQSLGNVNGKTESHAGIPLTEYGHEMIRNFLDLAKEWRDKNGNRS